MHVRGDWVLGGKGRRKMCAVLGVLAIYQDVPLGSVHFSQCVLVLHLKRFRPPHPHPGAAALSWRPR